MILPDDFLRAADEIDEVEKDKLAISEYDLENSQKIMIHKLVNNGNSRKQKAEKYGVNGTSREGPSLSSGPARPIWILPSADPQGEAIYIPEATMRVCQILDGQDRFFVRGGRIVEVRGQGDDRRLVPMGPEEVAARIPRYCRPMAWRRAGDETVLAPRPKIPFDTAKQILAATPEIEAGLRPIETILRVPGIKVAGGNISSMVAGYNPEHGGTYVTSGVTMPEVDLGDATKLLAELLTDFHFVEGSDRSRAIAAMISPALRIAGLIPGHLPIFFVEADDSQTGKGYLTSLFAAIYGERQAIVTQRRGGVGSLDESVSHALVEGRPFVCLDNIRGSIDSPLMEAILTPTGLYTARIPHSGSLQVDPRRYIFSATSNGAELTRDLVNRACIIRIRKRPPGYRYRRWLDRPGDNDLLAFVDEHQPQILGAVHAVVRHWYERGRPTTETTDHSFRGWAGILDWIVQEVFSEAPILEGHRQVQTRAGDPVGAFLRKIAMAAIAADRDTWSATDLAELCLEEGIQVPRSRPNADEKELRKKIGILLGKHFRTENPVRVDEFIIARDITYDHISRKEAKSYQFERGTT